MDAQFFKIAGTDFSSILLVISYGIYSEISKHLNRKKTSKELYEAKNVSLKKRAQNVGEVHRRLKLLELEDGQYYTKINELRKEQQTEVRNYINGTVLSLEYEIRSRVEKSLIVDDDGNYHCPNTGEMCAVSSKVIGATVSSYTGALGKVMKNLKDYIWSVVLLNGFYELDREGLKRYVVKKSKILRNKLGEEMKEEMPKGLALKYESERLSKKESEEQFSDLVDGIIEIKDRYSNLRKNEFNRHAVIIQKIYDDTPESVK